MRTRIVRNPAAAKTLISLLPLLGVKASDDAPATDFDNDLRITWLVRRAIETESLEEILYAPEADRVMIVRRIHAFALTANHDPKKIVARVKDGANQRAMTLGALQAIAHQAPFNYMARFKEEHRRRR